MSQVTTPQVPSGSGLSVREAINAVMAALMSSNSGSSEPPNPMAGMVWFDTTANDLKIRNAANTAWLLISDMIGALEYDRAQALTSPQQGQVRANAGLGTAVAASAALGIVSARMEGAYRVADFVSSNGQTWRLLATTLVKAASSVDSIYVPYPVSFIVDPIVTITNGDTAPAGAAILSVFSPGSAGFTIVARNYDNSAFTGSFRANYMAFGRLL